ncbi:MAG: hypothetical protein QM756_29180 [Polyangiaceae bacterium]
MSLGGAPSFGGTGEGGTPIQSVAGGSAGAKPVEFTLELMPYGVAQQMGQPIIPSCEGDSDGDGLSDFYEGRTEQAEQSLDSDFDGTPDYLDLDSDNDTISDRLENGFREFPCAPPRDTDHDGVPNYLDRDSDGDAELDFDELFLQSDPLNRDTNSNGCADFVDQWGLPCDLNAHQTVEVACGEPGVPLPPVERELVLTMPDVIDDISGRFNIGASVRSELVHGSVTVHGVLVDVEPSGAVQIVDGVIRHIEPGARLFLKVSVTPAIPGLVVQIEMGPPLARGSLSIYAPDDRCPTPG